MKEDEQEESRAEPETAPANGNDAAAAKTIAAKTVATTATEPVTGANSSAATAASVKTNPAPSTSAAAPSAAAPPAPSPSALKSKVGKCFVRCLRRLGDAKSNRHVILETGMTCWIGRADDNQVGLRTDVERIATWRPLHPFKVLIFRLSPLVTFFSAALPPRRGSLAQARRNQGSR